MNASGKGAAGSYARAIERMWSGLCGRAVILSPRDWSMIKEWHERGIPLQIIEEAIEAAAERRKRGKEAPPPRGLAYIAQAVDEGWMAVLEGRRDTDQAAEAVAEQEPSAIACWRDKLSREPGGSALHILLSELVAAYERGEDAGELDRLLLSGLPKAVPGELLRAVELEAERELAPYRERMAPGIYEATMRRAIAIQLRRRLELDRLSPP